jgi:hypothetical protein
MSESVEEITGTTPTEGLSQTLVPLYIEGDNKARFLGYLIAGFSKIEAKRLVGIADITLVRWMNGDPDFVSVLNKIPELREQLGNQLLDLEFSRNFKLIMEKDFKVLWKDAIGAEMTPGEENYLLVIRKFYTPQHLGMMKQMLTGNIDNKKEAFDWTKMVVEMRVSKEEIHKR